MIKIDPIKLIDLARTQKLKKPLQLKTRTQSLHTLQILKPAIVFDKPVRQRNHSLRYQDA